ncbi:MAG: dipeptidase [Anaerolineae bacterium]|nr:dipeptidase [Anaerolineae bacterium]
MTTTDPTLAERAQALHADMLVIDALQAAPMTPTHFDRLQRGGIHAVNYTTANITSDFAAAALDLAKLHKTIEANSDQVLLVRTSQDILRAREEGKTGLIMGLQNAKPLMDNVDYVRILHLIGVRVIQLTYNERNFIGDGCVEQTNGGLSRYGRRVVADMNRFGMLVDLSHCGERTTLDAIEASAAPVVASHANAKSLCPSPRNKSDQVLKALAERGGVIGAAFWAPMAYSDPNKRPTMDEFFAHIDYLVERAGIDHVGIGSDLGEGESREYYEAMFAHGGGIYPEVTQALGDWYDFDHRMVEGLETAVVFPTLTEKLLSRGYTEEDIRKIMGGNFFRVMAEVFDQGATSTS